MQRVAFVMRVKEGQQEEYIRRHQRVLARSVDGSEASRRP